MTARARAHRRRLTRPGARAWRYGLQVLRVDAPARAHFPVSSLFQEPALVDDVGDAVVLDRAIGIFLPGLYRLGYSSRNTIIGSTRVAQRAGK